MNFSKRCITKGLQERFDIYRKKVIRIAGIYPTLKKDYPYWLGDRPIEREYGRVTHWMPLPKPPKEV